MKKALILFIVILICLTVACDQTKETDDGGTIAYTKETMKKLGIDKETDATNESDNSVEVDTSWYTDDNHVICDGIYLVGKDIDAENYIFTCGKPTDTTTVITIFENEDKYLSYFALPRYNGGQENEALSQNAILTEYLEQNESYALNLKEGNVLQISSGFGYLELASGDSDQKESPIIGDSRIVVDGVYNVDDVERGGYMLSCTQSDILLKIVVFNNKDAYERYESSERYNGGQENEALSQNAWCVNYIESGETCYVNLVDDRVLMIDGGRGKLEPVIMNWNK